MPLDFEVSLDASLDLNAAVVSFCQAYRERARQPLETQLQNRIEALEAAWRGARQIRPTCFATPVGEIVLKRRAYLVEGHFICRVDQALGLPESGWLACLEELAAALGVSSEFSHAYRLLGQWTGVELSNHGLANRVEALGVALETEELAAEMPEVFPLDSALHRSVCRTQMPRPVVYVQADGVHVPMRQGTQEARVVNQTPCQAVVMGDGAAWIWHMADEEYPEAIQILDFFHVSESSSRTDGDSIATSGMSHGPCIQSSQRNRKSGSIPSSSG